MTDTKKYKTKTFFRSRDNGGAAKGTWPVAADIGYSSVKVFSPNRTLVFPSYAKPFKGETIGSLPDYYIQYRDLDKGETWLVGEAAQNDVGQGDETVSEEALFGRTRYDDPMFLVLVRTGLGAGMIENKFGEPGEKTVYLQTGLPPKYMKDKKDLVKAVAGRHRFSLKIGDMPEQEFDFEVRKENIGVMEQPKGTLMSVVKDSAHQYIPDAKKYFNRNVLIFDAGFGTLDIFPIVNNHVAEKQTFPEFSMKQVLKETIEAIEKEYGETVSMVGIQKCLGSGFVLCQGKFKSRKEEFGDLLEEASANVCDRALERLGQIYRLPEFDYLVITGGTGAAWNSQIHEKLKELETLTIVDGNQNDTSLPFMTANARGYYMYLCERLSRTVKGGK